MELLRRHLFADDRLHAVGALALALWLTAPVAAVADDTQRGTPAVDPTPQISVEVSPLRVEMKTSPGGTTTQAITIHNTGAAAVRVRATISDWYLSMEGAPQFAPATDARYSASEWTRLAPPEQIIEANREGTVRFTIAVPADASAAGYRTSILFDFGPADGSAIARGHDVVVRSRIATLIYANVGDPAAAVDLSDLKARTVADRPAQIVATLRNTGRRTVRTRGTMAIYDGSGTKVREITVPDVPVLPESEREVAIDTADRDATQRLPPGEYRVEVRIDVGMAAVLVGETRLKVS
jgi:hypothetical protein